MKNNREFLTYTERIAALFLSALLMIGVFILYQKNSRPFRKITTVEDGIKKSLTMCEIERRLIERRKVNINSAGLEELVSIPGIGSALADRIIECRRVRGRFATDADLMEVPGIGEKKLEKMRDWIRCK